MREFIDIPSGEAIFLRQGDLDGACTVYSLMMGLVAAKKVKKDYLTDLEKYDNTDRRESLGRLLKEFFYKVPQSKDDPESVLLRNGYTLEAIQAKLSRSYSRVVTSWYASSERDEDEEGYMDKSQLLDFISAEIDQNRPVEIAFTYRGSDSGHAVLAVGYERLNGELHRLFCLDPSFDKPKRGYYNAIVDLFHNGKRIQYHQQMERVVCITEALSFV